MKADLILHPVRLRILTALAGGRKLTTQGISESLPEVPQATLYRHLNTLVKNGLVEVVSTQQIRGATEKTYSLPTGSNYVLTADELNEVSKEQQLQYFASFLVTLLGDFQAYLTTTEKPDMMKDTVGYRTSMFWLTTEEALEMVGKLREVAAEYAMLTEGPGRKRRLFSTVIMPGADTEKEKSE